MWPRPWNPNATGMGYQGVCFNCHKVGLKAAECTEAKVNAVEEVTGATVEKRIETVWNVGMVQAEEEVVPPPPASPGYEKVEILPDNKADEKKKTLKCKDIWYTIQFSPEYKALSFRERNQYSMKQLFLWLEEMTPITGNTKTGKLIVGYLPKEEASNDGGSDAETENQFVGGCVVGQTY